MSDSSSPVSGSGRSSPLLPQVHSEEKIAYAANYNKIINKKITNVFLTRILPLGLITLGLGTIAVLFGVHGGYGKFSLGSMGAKSFYLTIGATSVATIVMGRITKRSMYRSYQRYQAINATFNHLMSYSDSPASGTESDSSRSSPKLDDLIDGYESDNNEVEVHHIVSEAEEEVNYMQKFNQELNSCFQDLPVEAKTTFMTAYQNPTEEQRDHLKQISLFSNGSMFSAEKARLGFALKAMQETEFYIDVRNQVYDRMLQFCGEADKARLDLMES